MRMVSVITSLVTLVGFASSAGASATIDLIWSDGGTHTTLATSSTTVLKIVLTNDVLNIGASVSVDYSAAAGEFLVVGLFNNPNAGTSPFLPLSLGPTIDSGSTVESFNAASLGPGLPGGQSYLLGTITFHKSLASSGTFSIFAFLNPTDAISDGGGGSLPASQVTLGAVTAQLPEPGTAWLLALGLVGLALAGKNT